MIKRHFKLIILILAVIVMLFTAGCAEVLDIIDYEVEIMLAESENLTVNGGNTVTVKAGETAEFDVTVPEGMKVASISDGAYYEDGKIKLENVYFPATIKTVVREYLDCTYSVSATTGGQATKANGVTVREDETVMVQATPNKGYTFIGWSEGKTLANGGSVLSDKRVYEFSITSDMKLYANFIGRDAVVIRYDANGGAVVESDGETLIETVEDDYHFYANSLPDMDYFERDGYILYGYNTEPDGSGRYFGLGWNIITDEKIVNLYCMWAKESPEENFEYERSGKGVKITKYVGDDETVVVPEKLGKKKVLAIAKSAFKGLKAETIILPSTLTEIEERGFYACSFKSLYMPDSVVSVSDNSFVNCKNFEKLYVNAVRHPTYQTSNHGTYAIKFERLMYAYEHDLKKLVFTSGSNGTYGILSEQLEKGLKNEYYIVDYSCHFQTSGMFFIDLISQFLKEDDIMLFCPEPNDYQLGSNSWTAVMWQFFEAAYGCITYIDIRDYDYVFGSYAEYNSTRQWMSKTKYTHYWDGINRYGDNDWYRGGQYNGFVGSQGNYDLKTDHIDTDLMNSVIDKCLEKGAKAYFSFPSLNEHAAVGPAKKKGGRKDYEDYIRDNLHTTLISDINDYIFNGKYMADTNYHLSTEGTKIRTDRLIDDIMAQLKKDYPDTWGKQ